MKVHLRVKYPNKKYNLLDDNAIFGKTQNVPNLANIVDGTNLRFICSKKGALIVSALQAKALSW